MLVEMKRFCRIHGTLACLMRSVFNESTRCAFADVSLGARLSSLLAFKVRSGAET